MLLLGIDIGTSSSKVSVIDAATRKTLISTQFPEAETPILIPRPGWAEQHPEDWWENAKQAIRKANSSGLYNSKNIGAIGISYQMHGLVLVNRYNRVLRPSIIWCDSRAVELGNDAFEKLGADYCQQHLLNSPGNFTASKLAWVKRFEPHIYQQIDKILLPGDWISLCLTGQATTSISAMSEGVFWDFKEKQLSASLFSHFGLHTNYIPTMEPVFGHHGQLSPSVADDLGLKSGISVSYKCGDQPNNALSLNVLQPGEVAATAGTSGVIYGVTDQLAFDEKSRVNSFAHVNHTNELTRIGILLCINGTGNAYNWVRRLIGNQYSYKDMNLLAQNVEPGSNGLQFIPFGNGAERMLENRIPGASLHGIDLNVHLPAHYFRAVTEGIAFSFRYGLDIMRSNGLKPTKVRVGKANLFLSDVFQFAFTNTTGLTLELYDSEGSVGAALGAGIGMGIFTLENAFEGKKPVQKVEPGIAGGYEPLYQKWLHQLKKNLALTE